MTRPGQLVEEEPVRVKPLASSSLSLSATACVYRLLFVVWCPLRAEDLGQLGAL